MLFCQEDLHYRPPEYDGTCFAVLENRTSWGVIQECDCVDNLIFRVVLMCTFIDVFKLWSEDKPVRGQSFALPGGAFKQNPRPCSVSPHFEFCQSSVRGPLPHIPIIFVADMVAEERRCRGTAMSDTVGMPTRHHGQPNHQLSLALTLPPPLYRGMPTTQPQSTCVRARLPHARELPTREKGKIGSGAMVSPWFQHYKQMPFSATGIGGPHAPAVEASRLWPGGQQWQA